VQSHNFLNDLLPESMDIVYYFHIFVKYYKAFLNHSGASHHDLVALLQLLQLHRSGSISNYDNFINCTI